MRVRRISALLACIPLLVVVLASGAAAERPDDPGANGQEVATAARVCAHAPQGYAECHSLLRVTPDGKPDHSVPISYTAAQLQAAYALSTAAGSRGGSQTIAIVDAFDNPRAGTNLATYRSTNGLPACGSPCFRKVNQRGVESSYPAENVGWAQEIDLDLDMASAICPNCKLLLVEADSNSLADLAAAVATAAQMGATQISNSYGGSDLPDSSYGASYNRPSVAITASTGDNGYGVSFPASSAYVTAVGGTSLRTASNARGYTETVWSGAGSGCSRYNAKPSFQQSVATGCANRAVADVSAVADPNTGVRVFSYTSTSGASSWLTFGGTSVSAPIIAGVYALAADLNGATGNAKPYASGSAAYLNDVTTGSNGRCRTVLCTAGTGWDGPTGLGTPNGVGAF